MNSDPSTLTLGPLDTLAGKGDGLPLIPALTVIWHPDVTRIGHLAPLTALLEHDVAAVHRDEPIFYVPGSSKGGPLHHRSIGRVETRGPVLLVRSKRQGFEIERGTASTDVELDGQAFQGIRPVSSEDLSRGLIFTLGRRIVLCLHAVRFPVVRSPSYGLLGSGDAIEDLRRAIARAADRNIGVLIRGETGTGKELVAAALHKQSRRGKGPFVSVNMGSLGVGTAAAALFGHEKGAFTGAVDSRPGHFRSAHGGTLFLDEIALTPKDVQPTLLRALQDHQVQAVGASALRSVDVRVLAATDAKLERAIADQRFDAPLYYRLKEYTMAVPPLRERREDIGVLLLHFLQHSLSETDELFRLAEPTDGGRPWLSARTVARIALAPWPGNVRDLGNLASHLVTSPLPDTDQITTTFLAEASAMAEPVSGPASLVEPVSSRPEPITKDRLLRALETLGWNQTHAAKALGVSRTTIWKLIGRDPDISRVTEIPIDDLIRDSETCGGDLAVLGARLGIAADVLRRRLSSSKP